MKIVSSLLRDQELTYCGEVPKRMDRCPININAI